MDPNDLRPPSFLGESFDELLLQVCQAISSFWPLASRVATKQPTGVDAVPAAIRDLLKDDVLVLRPIQHQDLLAARMFKRVVQERIDRQQIPRDGFDIRFRGVLWQV